MSYIRWEMHDGPYFVRLFAGKTRVTPKMKVTIPRVELLGAVMAVRLAKKIQEIFQLGSPLTLHVCLVCSIGWVDFCLF